MHTVEPAYSGLGLGELRALIDVDLRRARLLRRTEAAEARVQGHGRCLALGTGRATNVGIKKKVSMPRS